MYMTEPKHAGATVRTEQGIFIRVNDGATIHPWVRFPLDSPNYELYHWEDVLRFGI